MQSFQKRLNIFDSSEYFPQKNGAIKLLSIFIRLFLQTLLFLNMGVDFHYRMLADLRGGRWASSALPVGSHLIEKRRTVLFKKRSNKS